MKKSLFAVKILVQASQKVLCTNGYGRFLRKGDNLTKEMNTGKYREAVIYIVFDSFFADYS